MKIGIYDPYLDSLSGGEKYILTAASCLSRENDVTIFWDDPHILDKAYQKLRIDLSKTTIKPNIFSKKATFLNRLFLTRMYDYLIILSDGSIPITLAKKTILHFQFPVEWVKGNDLITKIKLLKINTIICNSEFTKKFIDKKFKINSQILYPPCISSDLKEFSTQKMADKKNIILTVGRYSPLSHESRINVSPPSRRQAERSEAMTPGRWTPENSNSIKKLEVMIDVFEQMVDNGLRNWKFVAAISFLKENKKYLDDLEAMTKGYQIKIIKNSQFNELEKLYHEAKIYWHATGFGEDTEKHPERAEHFGITTVEAMAHKVVPIVIEKGGQPEIVNDNIDGFLWETKEELMQKTKKLMIDNSLREQMANLAQKKSWQFTVEKFCEELQKIIK